MHDAHDGTDGQIVNVESHDGCVNWIGQDTFIVTHCFLVPLMPTLIKLKSLLCRDKIMHIPLLRRKIAAAQSANTQNYGGGGDANPLALDYSKR